MKTYSLLAWVTVACIACSTNVAELGNPSAGGTQQSAVAGREPADPESIASTEPKRASFIDRSGAIAVASNALTHGGETYPVGIEILLSENDPRSCDGHVFPARQGFPPWKLDPGGQVVRLDVRGSLSSLPAPGRYTLGDLKAYRTGFDATCEFQSSSAAAATLEIDVIDDGHVSGAVDLVLSGGEHLRYTFDAPFCVKSTPGVFGCAQGG